MARFNGIDINIANSGTYGHYTLTANYKDTWVKTITTDSECFDYLEDESDKARHLQAKRHAYAKIRDRFNSM